MKLSDYANPECEDCGGEGVCEYARGEDTFTDICDTCFKGQTAEDLFEDDRYEELRDERIEMELDK